MPILAIPCGSKRHDENSFNYGESNGIKKSPPTRRRILDEISRSDYENDDKVRKIYNSLLCEIDEEGQDLIQKMCTAATERKDYLFHSVN